MATEHTRQDYREAFKGAGAYYIRCRLDGKGKWTYRWFDAEEELVRQMDDLIVRGYDVVAVEYKGN